MMFKTIIISGILSYLYIIFLVICLQCRQHLVQADLNSIISFDRAKVPPEFAAFLQNQPRYREKVVNVNFGSLNMKKMTGRLDKLVERYRENHTMYKIPYEFDHTMTEFDLNLTLDSLPTNELDLTEGNITANDTRRQMTYRDLHKTYDMSKWTRYVQQGESRLKILDLMLQTIYMARHYIQDIENSSYFNSEHSQYKVGSAFNKMHSYKGDMYAILETIKNGIQNIHSDYYYKGGWFWYPTGYNYWDYPNRGEMRHDLAYIVLHQKAWKIYTIYDYLYRVLLKVHDMSNKRANKKNNIMGKLV